MIHVYYLTPIALFLFFYSEGGMWLATKVGAFIRRATGPYYILLRPGVKYGVASDGKWQRWNREYGISFGRSTISGTKDKPAWSMFVGFQLRGHN